MSNLDTGSSQKPYTTASIPEILVSPKIGEYLKTIQTLIAYGRSFLDFLEKTNVFLSLHSLDKDTFEGLMTMFHQHYKQASKTPQDLDLKFELVQIEQSLSMMTKFPLALDPSSYLALIEDFCLDHRICEIIVLLDNKNYNEVDGGEESYLQFLYFLAPFLQCLLDKELKYREIFNVSKQDSLLMIKQSLACLQTRLKRHGVDLDYHTEQLEELRLLPEKMEELKKLLLEKPIPRKEHFYYELGLCSFVYHLARQSEAQDYTFLEIFICASNHLGKIKKRTQNLEVKKDIDIICSVKPSSLCWESLMDELCSLINYQRSSFEDKVPFIHLLYQLVNLICGHKLAEKSKFIKANLNSDMFILELFRLLCSNKESLLTLGSRRFGKFLNLYEDLFSTILLIVRNFLNNLSSDSETEEILDTIIKQNIQIISQPNPLRPIIRKLCYEGPDMIAYQDQSFSSHVLKNWNFSGESLLDLISSPKEVDIEELAFEVHYILCYFQRESGAKSFLDKIGFKGIVRCMEAYVNKINKNIESLNEINKLKYLGFFITGLLCLEVASEGIDSKLNFICSVFEFIRSKCELDERDLAFFHQNIFLLIENTTQSCESILPTIANIIIFSELEATKHAVILKTFSGKFIEIDFVKQKIIEILNISLEDTAQGLVNIFEKVNKTQSRSSIEEALIIGRNISKRFICFAIHWTKWLLTSLKPEEKEEDLNTYMQIVGKLMMVFFDPILPIISEKRDSQLINQYYNDINKKNHFARWAAFQVIAEILTDKMLLFNKKPLPPGGFLINELDNIMNSDSEGVIRFILLGQGALQSLAIQSLIRGLSDLANIFISLDMSLLGNDEEGRLLKIYTNLIEPLSDFLLKVSSVDKFSLKDENSPRKVLDSTVLLFSKFSEFQSYKDIPPEFCCSLLEKSFNSYEEYNYKPIFNVLARIISQIGLQSKITVFFICHTQLWSSIFARLHSFVYDKFNMKKIPEKELESELILIDEITFALKSKFTSPTFRLRIVKKSPETEETITNLFKELGKKLNTFPIKELISLRCTTLDNILISILKIFERSYKLLDKVFKDKKDIALQNMLEKMFYSKIDLLYLVYPFEKIKDNNKFEIAILDVESSFMFLTRFMLNFYYKVSKREESQEVEHFPYENIPEDKDFIIHDNSTPYKQILNFGLYLNIMMNTFQDMGAKLPTAKLSLSFSINDSYFLWLCFTFKIMLENLLEDNSTEANLLQDNTFYNKFSDIIKHLQKSLLTEFKSKCPSETQSRFIISWIDTILKANHYLSKAADSYLNSETFDNLLTLLKLVAASNFNASITLDKDSVLRRSIEMPTPCWSKKTLSLMTSIFLALLEKYLPQEPIIKEGVRRIDSSKGLLDISKEEVLKDEIKQIFNGLGGGLREIIDMLMKCILESSLSNLVEITSRVDPTPVKESHLKPTSHMITILSTIMLEHPSIRAYVAFGKKDYQSIFQPCFDKESFIKHCKIKRFKQITFLECLFKLKHFSLYNHDLLMIISSLRPKTGITFRNPLDMDLSHLLVNKVLALLMKQIKRVLKDPKETPFESLERYLVLYSTVSSLNCLLKDFDKPSQRQVYENYLKEDFLALTRKVLEGFGRVSRAYCKVNKFHLIIDNLLITLLQSIRKAHLNLNSVDQHTFEKLKSHDYHRFLETSCQSLSREPNKYIKLVKSEIESYLKETSGDQKNLYGLSSRFERDDLRKSNGEPETALNIERRVEYPMDSKLRVFSNENACRLIENVKLFEAFCFSYHEACQEINFIRNYGTYLKALSPILGPSPSYRYCILKKNIDTNQTSGGIRFYEIIFNKNKEESVPNQDEEQKESTQIIPEAQVNEHPKINESLQEQESKASSKSNHTKHSRIRYFYSETLQTHAHFDLLKRRLISQLKLINEKILVEMANSTLPSEALEEYRKHRVKEEVEEKLKGMEWLESNLFICLLEEFDSLQPYTHFPHEFKEIKQEYQWINKNFSSYIKTLNKNRGQKNIPLIQVDANAMGNVSCEVFFPKDFCFLDTSDSISNQCDIQSLLNRKEIFIEMLNINDNMVESVLSVFFKQCEQSDKLESSSVQLLQELCNIPLFETKLIDFCIFFLYCQDYLKSPSHSANNKFPYSGLINSDLSQTPNKVYHIVSHNILAFLKSYLEHRLHLIYQPRVYLESYGLKSLRRLKKQYGFFDKTAHMVSLCDLLIGLPVINTIVPQLKLLTAAKELISTILKKPQQFKIMKVNGGEELLAETKVLSLKSCDIIYEIKTMEILANVPESVLYNLKLLITSIEKEVETLFEPLRTASSRLEVKLKEPSNKITSSDISKIIALESKLTDLEQLMLLISSVMARSLLNIYTQEKTSDGLAEIYHEAKQVLEKLFLHTGHIEDFIAVLFKLSNLLAQEQFLKIKEAQPGIWLILKICFHFFSLICIHDANPNCQEPDQGKDSFETSTPINLFNNVFKESVDHSDDAPYPYFTFSGETLSEKYQLYLFHIFKRSLQVNGSLGPATFICQKLPWILEAQTKSQLLMKAINIDLQRLSVGTEIRDLLIDRKDLIKSTLAEFTNKPIETLKQKVKIIFEGEEGFDAGGLTREWITLVTNELFNSQMGLFKASEDGINIQPNPLSKSIPNHLKYFELAGILLAKAIQEECVVDANLTKSFSKHILRRQITLNDLEDVDPNLAKNLRWILKNNIDELKQSFTYEINIFGENITQELMKNGYDVILNEDNKQEFVKRICERKMKEEISEQLHSFLSGFYLIIPPDFLDLFTVSEFQVLIAGNPQIDLEDMKKHAIYQGYNQNSSQIKWLWEVLAELSQKELASFVFFVSGSVKPPVGFKENPISFARTSYGNGKLPISHTCSWVIEIPEYTTKNELEQKVKQAILEGKGGFTIR